MDTLTDTLQAARTATTALVTSEQQLRDNHTAAQQARDALYGAMGPADELVENMRRLVDARTQYETEQYGGTIVRAFAGDSELRMTGRRQEIAPALPLFPLGMAPMAVLCLLAPQMVKQNFERIIRAHASEEGVPAAERADRVKAAEAAVRAIEDEHERLVDEASAAGITMRHLPDVQQRRDTEAARVQREQAAAEAHHRAHNEVNTHPMFFKEDRGPKRPEQVGEFSARWENG